MGSAQGIACVMDLFSDAPAPSTNGLLTPKPDGFETFWAAYPRKVGKLAARKAYQAARKLATEGELLDGLERYRQTKPSYADWCHPKTWLNQGRWMDETPVPLTGSARTSGTTSHTEWICPHTPRCPHRTACAVVAMRPDAS